MNGKIYLNISHVKNFLENASILKFIFNLKEKKRSRGETMKKNEEMYTFTKKNHHLILQWRLILT